MFTRCRKRRRCISIRVTENNLFTTVASAQAIGQTTTTQTLTPDQAIIWGENEIINDCAIEHGVNTANIILRACQTYLVSFAIPVTVPTGTNVPVTLGLQLASRSSYVLRNYLTTVKQFDILQATPIYYCDHADVSLAFALY